MNLFAFNIDSKVVKMTIFIFFVSSNFPIFIFYFFNQRIFKCLKIIFSIKDTEL